MTPPALDYDVVIAGYGPTGVTAANALGQAGIRTLAVERERDIYPRARAVTVDDWTLRLYQALGLDAELKAEMDLGISLRWKTYSGREFLRVTPPDMGSYGQPFSAMIYQPAMEATLRRGTERFSDHVDVVFGERVTDFEQDANGVTVTIADAATDQTRTVRAKYLVGCDGGSSRIRERLGVGLTGMSHDETWVVIDARVKRWWPERDLLTFWSDRDRPVVDIPLALDHHRWELPLRGGERREDLEGKEALWELLTPLGVTPEHVEIQQHAFYEHHVLRAERWRSGRVLLAGDAAHMMPPWAGQGMQSGVRDAQNLAWKLALVLRGAAPSGLLDTYQTEREPHVVEMTNLARGMGLLIGARNPVGVAARNYGLAFLQRTPVVGTALQAFKFKPPPRIKAGFLAGKPTLRNAVGRMVPQPDVARADGTRTRLDDTLGTGFAVLGRDVDPRERMTQAEVAGWEALGAHFVTVRSVHRAPQADDDIADFTDQLCPWMARHHAEVMVVRPDRFVAATDAGSLAPPKISGSLEATGLRPQSPSPA